MQIFIIDGSAGEEELKHAFESLAETASHPEMAGKPLCVIINKVDIEPSLQNEQVPPPHETCFARLRIKWTCMPQVIEAVGSTALQGRQYLFIRSSARYPDVRLNHYS